MPTTKARIGSTSFTAKHQQMMAMTGTNFFFTEDEEMGVLTSGAFILKFNQGCRATIHRLSVFALGGNVKIQSFRNPTFIEANFIDKTPLISNANTIFQDVKTPIAQLLLTTDIAADISNNGDPRIGEITLSDSSGNNNKIFTTTSGADGVMEEYWADGDTLLLVFKNYSSSGSSVVDFHFSWSEKSWSLK
jgi:hypothetical protein